MKFYAFWFDFAGDYLEYVPLANEGRAVRYAERFADSDRTIVMGVEG